LYNILDAFIQAWIQIEAAIHEDGKGKYPVVGGFTFITPETTWTGEQLKEIMKR
jgi:hypothetical protein